MDNSNEGFLIGTFTYQSKELESMKILSEVGSKLNDEYNEFGFRFRSKGGKRIGGNIVSRKKQKGLFCGVKTHEDFSIDGGGGHYFVVPLPPGKYEFYECYVDFGYKLGLIGATLTHKSYSVPFQIKPKEALYIGEVRAVIFYVKALFGRYSPERFIFEAYDQSEKDIPIIKQKFPFINDCQVKKRIITDDLGDALKTMAFIFWSEFISSIDLQSFVWTVFVEIQDIHTQPSQLLLTSYTLPIYSTHLPIHPKISLYIQANYGIVLPK